MADALFEKARVGVVDGAGAVCRAVRVVVWQRTLPRLFELGEDRTHVFGAGGHVGSWRLGGSCGWWVLILWSLKLSEQFVGCEVL